MTIDSDTQNCFYRPLSFNFFTGASISHIFLLKPVVNSLNHSVRSKRSSRTKVRVSRIKK